MQKSKEKVKTIHLKPDGTEDAEKTTEKVTTIYKKKDNREWAHHGKTYLQVDRSSGTPTIKVPHGNQTATAAPSTPPPAT